METMILLAVVGLVIGFYRKLFFLVPVTAIITLVSLTIWIWQSDLNWFKLVIWFGYLVSLNAGFLAGSFAAYLRPIKTPSSARDKSHSHRSSI